MAETERRNSMVACRTKISGVNTPRPNPTATLLLSSAALPAFSTSALVVFAVGAEWGSIRSWVNPPLLRVLISRTFCLYLWSKGLQLLPMDRVPNGRRKGSVNPKVVLLSDSDSDSEGSVEELTPVPSKSNGKASSQSLKTGGKDSSFSKGEASKGKEYSGSKGGKGSVSNAVPTKTDAELKLQLDIPHNSRMLMNCEASELLQEIHEHMAILSEDPRSKFQSHLTKLSNMQKLEIISPLQTL